MTAVDPKAIYAVKLQMASTIAERHDIALEYSSKKKLEDGSIELHIVQGMFLQQEFIHEVTRLLNNLEWFAMSCRYGLADEKMLYQSLHQTFLSHIWLLYFYICKSNFNNEDKLYTNIIWLFNLWKDRLRSIQLQTLKSKEAAVQELAAAQQECVVAERKAEEAMAKVASAQSDIYTGSALK